MRYWLGRRAVVVVASALGAAVASAPASAQIALERGPERASVAGRTLTIPLPEQGEVSIAAFQLRVTTRNGKRLARPPRLTVKAATLPETVSVAVSATRVPRTVNRFLVTVVALNRDPGAAPRHADLGTPQVVLQVRFAEAGGAFVRAVGVDWSGIVPAVLTHQVALPPQACAATQAPGVAKAATWAVGPPAGQPATVILEVTPRVACGTGSAAEEGLLSLLVKAVVPELVCSLDLGFFSAQEVEGDLRCNQGISGFGYRVPSGYAITAWLPATCGSDGARLACPGVPANTPFHLNVRTSPSPATGFGGTVTIHRDGLADVELQAKPPTAPPPGRPVAGP